MEPQELPAGFSMALAQHPDAMAHFASLPREAKWAIVKATHSIQSKEEMQTYVANLML